VHIASAESWWIVEVAIPRTAALPSKKKRKAKASNDVQGQNTKVL
jgi:hypothetical protein